jgi:hypothetical protein
VSKSKSASKKTKPNKTLAAKVENWLKQIRLKPVTSGLSVVGIIIIIWLVGSTYLYLSAPGQIFRTERSMNEVLPVGYQRNFEKLSNGEKVELWSFDNPRSQEVILYLHGNSGRIPYYFEFLGLKYDVMAPAYPGFGFSTGSPNVDNVYETAIASYEFLLDQGYEEDQITIFGHSMGGAPATYLASQKPDAKELVLVAAFDSIQSLCWDNYSIFCVFGEGLFNTAKYAEKVTIPVRQYHLPDDSVIPFEKGQKLYTYFTATEDKSFIELSGQTHSYFDPSEVFDNKITRLN